VNDVISLRKTVEYWAGYEDSRAHQQKVIDALVAAIDVERISDLLTQVEQLKSLIDAFRAHHREVHSLCKER
jgi:hypothetical protein